MKHRTGSALLEEMTDLQLGKNTGTYSACSNACEIGAKWQLVLALAEDATEFKLGNDTITHRACVSACDGLSVAVGFGTSERDD